MRLNKYLSKCGIASRRESDELIQRGTTTVNGKMVLDPALSVSDADVIKYDGKTIKPINYRLVLMLNKPKNVITTVKDTHNRRTVMEYVPSNVRVVPVGRLDKDTTGLLLLTNDGDLLQFLSHPKNRIPREYVAEITGIMTPIQIAKLKKGIYIGDGEYGRAEIVSQKKEQGSIRCYSKVATRKEERNSTNVLSFRHQTSSIKKNKIWSNYNEEYQNR